jgi:hypothetical protein
MALGTIDAFFGWVKDNQSPRTVEWYERQLRVFQKSVPARFLLSELKPFDVTQILGSPRASEEQNRRIELLSLLQCASG